MKETQYTDHEIRIRLLEEMNKTIQESINELEVKMDTRVLLVIGVVITSIATPVLLHYLKLT